MLLNTAVYRRLSNVFLIKLFIRDCPLALNKAVYWRMSNGFFFFKKKAFVLVKVHWVKHQ